MGNWTAASSTAASSASASAVATWVTGNMVVGSTIMFKMASPMLFMCDDVGIRNNGGRMMDDSDRSGEGDVLSAL